MIKVAIIGSRDYPWPENIRSACEYLQEVAPGWILISGGARGVDSWAEEIAKELGAATEIFPADWDRFGRGAGLIRNGYIINVADLVIAFWDGKSRGTKHSIDLAQKLGKACWVVGV